MRQSEVNLTRPGRSAAEEADWTDDSEPLGKGLAVVHGRTQADGEGLGLVGGGPVVLRDTELDVVGMGIETSLVRGEDLPLDGEDEDNVRRGLVGSWGEGGGREGRREGGRENT